MTARIGLLGDRDPDSCLDLGVDFTAIRFPSLDEVLAADPPVAALIIAVPKGQHVNAEIRKIRATTAGFHLPILLLIDSVGQYSESIDIQGSAHHDGALVDFCAIDGSCEEITVRLVWLIESAAAAEARVSSTGSDRMVALYERLMNSLSDMIAVVDQDGHHLLFNRAGRDLCAIPDSVPTGTIDGRDLTPQDTLQVLSDVVFPAMRRDGSWAGRSELLSSTGERIPVWQQWFTITDPEGNQVLTGTHARDLRESDQLLNNLATTNAALASNTRRFDAIMRTTPDLVGFAAADGQLFNLNPAGRELLGIEPEDDLAGMKILDLHPEDLEQFARTVALPRAMRHGSWSGETSIVRTDGTTVPVWQVLMVIHDEAAASPILVTFVRDLRDLRSLQNQVEQAQEARARAEAAELAKSRFLANMSHEIRTPLNAVLGYSQLLEMDDLSSDQTESVRAIRRAGSHLLALINDVLDLSRIEAGASSLNPQPTDLHLLLAEVEAMFARECSEHGLRWHMTIDLPAPDWVMVDRQRLIQVIGNLLDNAIKFTEEGEVSLVVRRRIDGETVFEIADTGRGMTVSELTNVFAPFTQGTSGSLYGGTGLGLSITRNLVDMMRGNIRMSLRPQGGVKAVVSLPLLSTERITEEDLDPENRPVASYESLTAVVVDDVEDNRKVLANLLHRHAVGVREASNGLELLEVLEDFEPDIVFLDIRMPEMDGHAALAEAKRRWPDRSTLYVAVTATGIATTRATYLRYGFHDLIKKPFHFNEIAIFLAGVRDHAEAARPMGTLASMSAADRGTAVTPTGGIVPITEVPGPSTDTSRCHIPEPFRQNMVDAAELGRVIQLRRVLSELGDQLSNPANVMTADLTQTEIDGITDEMAYVKSLADSYDLERMVTYLTN